MTITTIKLEADARAAGYTRRVMAYSMEADVELLIKPDADLDGTFEGWDVDSREMVVVSGWLMESIEDLPDNAN